MQAINNLDVSSSSYSQISPNLNFMLNPKHLTPDMFRLTSALSTEDITHPYSWWSLGHKVQGIWYYKAIQKKSLNL
jgi:hypothetical protein